MTDGWIDITRPVRSGMEVWPGDPETSISLAASLKRGDSCNVTAFSMCAHCGTHVDAPLHYLEGGAAIDAMPLHAGVGPARVIEVRADLSPCDMDALDPAPGERLLFKGQVSLHLPAALRLVERRPLLVGVDSLSVGVSGTEGDQVHRALLSAGVWIVEGLDLAGVEAGNYDLVCLPLRLEGADGAPARALLRRRC